MVDSGQALGYKIGQLTILALRQKAEKEMGDRFDIKSFHTAVIESGNLPLSILSDKIENWIAENR